MSKTSPDQAREARIRESLAGILREARTRAGLTQAQLQRRLADRLGVETIAPTTVSRYENGAFAPPLGTLDALCEIIGGGEGALLDALRSALRPKKSRH